MTESLLITIVTKVPVITVLGLSAVRALRGARASVRHLVLLAVCGGVFATPMAASVLPAFEIPLAQHGVLLEPPPLPRDSHVDAVSVAAGSARAAGPDSRGVA